LVDKAIVFTGGALGALAGAALVVILLILAFTALISAIFMYIGARWAKVKGATFGRAFLAAVLSTAVIAGVTALFGSVDKQGASFGYGIGLLVAMLVIRRVYRTTYARACLAWGLGLAAQMIAFVVFVLLFAGGIAALLLTSGR
jgi:hypothetical protein